MTASVGIATLDRPHDSLDALFKRADQALYAAKRERPQPRGCGCGL